MNINELNNWNDISSIRSGSDITSEFVDFDNDEKYFFTPKLAPIVNHPNIDKYGCHVKKKILMYYACQHSNFTDTLETNIVVPLCSLLSREETCFDVNQTIKNNARKISVDEMYHSMFISNLEDNIYHYTKFERLTKRYPDFFYKFEYLLSGMSKYKRMLVHTFFVIISETLITETLYEIPSDDNVYSIVRDTIGIHLKDEAYHHMFFYQLLIYLWERLNLNDRSMIGVILPELLKIYHYPDKWFITESLKNSGVSDRDIKSAFNEIYTEENIIRTIKNSSKSTFRYLNLVGVFEIPEVEDAFFEQNLL